MPPPPADCLRWARGWLVPVALLAIAPKCVVCLIAYAGIGTALGLGGPELCGAPEPTDWTPVAFGALGAGGFLLHRFVRRPGANRS
jgi:MYXO-CTERM domain-containing protein